MLPFLRLSISNMQCCFSPPSLLLTALESTTVWIFTWMQNCSKQLHQIARPLLNSTKARHKVPPRTAILLQFFGKYLYLNSGSLVPQGGGTSLQFQFCTVPKDFRGTFDTPHHFSPSCTTGHQIQTVTFAKVWMCQKLNPQIWKELGPLNCISNWYVTKHKIISVQN